MTTQKRLDFVSIEKPVKLDNGFLKVPVRATRTGVFRYLKADGSVFREYRPPEEVFKEDSVESLAGVPLTNRHPHVLVDAQNAKKFMVGFTSDKVDKNEPFVETSVTITDAKTIDEVENKGLREVSCGYTCELEMNAGVTPSGEHFDAIQRNIVYNHLAVVDRGRAGKEVRLRMDSNSAILDEDDKNKDNPSQSTNKGGIMAKIKLDGVEYECEGSLATAVNSALKQTKKDSFNEGVESTKESTTALQAKVDEKDAKIDTLTEENKKLKEEKIDDAGIHAKVVERAKLTNEAGEVLGDKVVMDEMSNLEIKKAVVEKKCPELKLDEKSDVYVEARYDAIMETLKAEKNDNSKKVKKAMGDNVDKNDNDDEPNADKAREKSMKADSDAWQKPIGFHLNK
jgi:uncharacterized protein